MSTIRPKSMLVNNQQDSESEYFSCDGSESNYALENKRETTDESWLVAAREAYDALESGGQVSRSFQRHRSIECKAKNQLPYMARNSSCDSVGRNSNTSISLDVALQRASDARSNTTPLANKGILEPLVRRTSSDPRHQSSHPQLPSLSDQCKGQLKHSRRYLKIKDTVQLRTPSAGSSQFQEHDHQRGFSHKSNSHEQQYFSHPTCRSRMVVSSIINRRPSGSLSSLDHNTSILSVTESDTLVDKKSSQKHSSRQIKVMKKSSSAPRCRTPVDNSSNMKANTVEDDPRSVLSFPSLESAIRLSSALKRQSERNKESKPRRALSPSPNALISDPNRRNFSGESSHHSLPPLSNKELHQKLPVGRQLSSRSEKGFTTNLMTSRNRSHVVDQQRILLSEPKSSKVRGASTKEVKQDVKAGLSRGQGMNATQGSEPPHLELKKKKKNGRAVTCNIDDDGWHQDEIHALKTAMKHTVVGCENYWDLVAQAMVSKFPERRTAQECLRKAIRLEEEKLNACLKRQAPRNEPTVAELKSKIPGKGNSRGWRMNQLMQKLAFKDKSKDLLKSSIVFPTVSEATIMNETHNTQPLASARVTKGEDGNKKLTTESTIILESENHQQVTSEEPDRNSRGHRVSIPSWIMSSQQLQLLSSLHTGLTPRRADQERDTPPLPRTIPDGTTEASKDLNVRHSQLFLVSDDCSDNDDSNAMESQEYASRFAADVLERAQWNRTLDHQRLIDRHKKKAQEMNRIRCTKSRLFNGIHPQSKNTINALSSRFEILETEEELKSRLHLHEANQLKKQREEAVQSLRWTEDNALLEKERMAATDELNCILDQSDDEEMTLSDND